MRRRQCQDFSRTCQATCCTSRKCHCQGRRAERNLRQGGLRKREPPPDVDVRRGFSPCARLSAAGRARVAEADQRVEKGTRFVERRTNTNSQGASRDVVTGWSAICEGSRGDPRLYVCQAPNAFICVSSSVSILGPFWVHFGSILGPFWVHFGSISGPFRVHFRVHFGSILGPFGVPFGVHLGPFGVHLGSILGPFWVHFGSILLIV